MWRAWPWLVLAGCSSDGSVEVVVKAPAGMAVQEVELYVGIYHSHDDPMLLPPKGQLRPNVWWKRDPNPDVDVQTMDADGVRYQILAGQDSDEDSVAAVVAVGFESLPDSTLRAVGMASRLVWTDIPEGEVHRHILELGAFEWLPRSVPTQGGPGLQLWGGATKRDCVQVDQVRELADYAPAEAAMIVSIGDPDCDGLAEGDLECVANEYMSQLPIKRDDIQCAIPTTIEAGGTLLGCVAGGVTCVDGAGVNDRLCSPTSYCTPSGVCSGCPDPRTCDPFRVQSFSTTLQVSCDLYTTDSTVDPFFCPFTGARLDLKQLFPTYDLDCDPEKPALLRKGRMTPFAAEIPILAGPAKIKLVPLGGCLYDLQPEGKVPDNSSGTPLGEYNATLAVPLTAPVNGRGLLLPLHFAIRQPPSAACTTTTGVASYCAILANGVQQDAALDACLHQPTGPGTIVLD